MKTRIAAAVTFLGFLLVFGAVGGMEDPSKEAWFLEQCLVALVGLVVMLGGAAVLNKSNPRD